LDLESLFAQIRRELWQAEVEAGKTTRYLSNWSL
jgi:hypothetical protein